MAEEKVTLERFKSESPEEYKALIDDITNAVSEPYVTELGKKSEEIKTLMEENDRLSQNLDKTQDRILKLEKAEAIRAENEMKREAEVIWSSELANSDVPTRLHEKCKSMVSHVRFIDEGTFDKASFTEAVRTEITDWESRTKESVIGGATPPGSTPSEDELIAQDDEKGAKMLYDLVEGEATEH